MMTREPVDERKRYVKVIVEHMEDGYIRPLSIMWENGTVYEIDDIISITKRRLDKNTSLFIRYTIMIKGKKSHLFREIKGGIHEGGRWFVEAR